MSLFGQKGYTMQEIVEYGKYLETLDRLVEKAKRNYLGGGQQQKDLEILQGYENTLLVAQETYKRILARVAK